jgi:hypothetical protein
MLRLTFAALLLVLQLSPPALIHAHAVASASEHSHDAMSAHGHRHDAQGHSNGPEREGVSDEVSHVTPHLHLYLLGFEFALPISGDAPRSPNDNASNHFEATTGVTIRLLDDASTLSAACWNMPVFLSATSPTTFCGNLCQTAQAQFTVHDAPPWLCDSARHERSGVQLI